MQHFHDLGVSSVSSMICISSLYTLIRIGFFFKAKYILILNFGENYNGGLIKLKKGSLK